MGNVWHNKNKLSVSVCSQLREQVCVISQGQWKGQEESEQDTEQERTEDWNSVNKLIKLWTARIDTSDKITKQREE